MESEQVNFLKISLNLREGTRKIGKGSIEFYPMWPVERIWGALFIFSGNIHKRPHLLVLPPVDSRDNISIKVLSHKAEWVFVRKKRKQRNRNCGDLESALLLIFLKLPWGKGWMKKQQQLLWQLPYFSILEMPRGLQGHPNTLQFMQHLQSPVW